MLYAVHLRFHGLFSHLLPRRNVCYVLLTPSLSGMMKVRTDLFFQIPTEKYHCTQPNDYDIFEFMAYIAISCPPWFFYIFNFLFQSFYFHNLYFTYISKKVNAVIQPLCQTQQYQVSLPCQSPFSQ